jgi:hypothetical protein
MPCSSQLKPVNGKAQSDEAWIFILANFAMRLAENRILAIYFAQQVWLQKGVVSRARSQMRKPERRKDRKKSIKTKKICNNGRSHNA